MKFTHWVKVKVKLTVYHHTSILSTTVAHPDKYSKTYGGGPRVADPGADMQGWWIQSGGLSGRLIGLSWRNKCGGPSVADLQ